MEKEENKNISSCGNFHVPKCFHCKYFGIHRDGCEVVLSCRRYLIVFKTWFDEDYFNEDPDGNLDFCDSYVGDK